MVSGDCLYFRNSSAQDFAFTAKSVRMCRYSQGSCPSPQGAKRPGDVCPAPTGVERRHLEKLSFAQLADSVTGKPKAELLRIFVTGRPKSRKIKNLHKGKYSVILNLSIRSESLASA